MNKALERPQSGTEKKVYYSPEAKAEGSKKWKKNRILKLRNGAVLEIGKKKTDSLPNLLENTQNGHVKLEEN